MLEVMIVCFFRKKCISRHIFAIYKKGERVMQAHRELCSSSWNDVVTNRIVKSHLLNSILVILRSITCHVLSPEWYLFDPFLRSS